MSRTFVVREAVCVYARVLGRCTVAVCLSVREGCSEHKENEVGGGLFDNSQCVERIIEKKKKSDKEDNEENVGKKSYYLSFRVSSSSDVSFVYELLLAGLLFFFCCNLQEKS